MSFTITLEFVLSLAEFSRRNLMLLKDTYSENFRKCQLFDADLFISIVLGCKVEVTLSPYSDLVAVADALCAILFSLQCSVTPKMKIWAGRLLKAYLESFLKRDRVYVFDGADHSDKLSCFKPVAEGEWFLPCNRTPSSFSGVSSPQRSQDVEDSPSRPPSQKEIRR